MNLDYPPVTNNEEFDRWARRFIDTLRVGEFEIETLNVTNYAQINQYRLGQVGSWDITETTIQNGSIVISSSDNKITVNTVILDGAENEIRIGGTNLVLDADAEKITVGSNIEIDGANDRIDVNTITIDGANNRIRSDNYVSGDAGAGFHLGPDLLEVGNVAIRGIIRTAVFQKNVVSVVGGDLLVRPSDVLSTDMTALDASTVTIEGNETFAVNDIIRIKDGSDDEWMTVTNIGSAPTYTVTRDAAGIYNADSNPTWKKGAAVVNYGSSGDGGVYMSSSEVYSPYLAIFAHSGSPWGDLGVKARLGNLNGYLNYSTDIYGIGIGEADKYLTYETTNGLKVKGTINATSMEITGTATVKSLLQIQSSGSIRSNTTGAYPYIELSNSGIQLKDDDDGATYSGTGASSEYSDATALYGFGATVWIMNSHYSIPWMEVKEPVDGGNDMPSIRLYDRAATPVGGTYLDGDLAVVGGLLYIYNSGWEVVGDQTAP